VINILKFVLIILVIISIVFQFYLYTCLNNIDVRFTNLIRNMNNTITNNNVAIKNLSDKTIETSDSISNLNEIIAKQNNTIVDLNKKLKNLEEKVKQKGIVNPTYSDLLHFVSEDHTESKTYIEENDRFVCSDFANTFISNFYRKGYYSCMALLYFEDGCHSIVAVNTNTFTTVP